MTTREFDLIVIGAGPVGENVADRAKQGGLSVVVVESELVGGECSYWACMPSKTLLRSGAALRAARDVDGAKQAVTGGVDVAAALRRRDAIVYDWNDTSQVEWLQGAGIELVRGHGRLTGERAVAVEAPDGTTVHLVATHAVVVSTGSAALLPDIPGLVAAAPWTSRDATGVRDVPPSLAILGGGVVGSEMATLFTSFGTHVTVIARSGLLGGMEPFAGEAVEAALREAGADVRTGAEVDRVARTDGGDVVLSLSDGSEVRAAELLVATGRVPRTGDIGLETVGLASGEWLDVDDTLRVRGVDWLYGVGDVNHRALLTHQGKYQGRAAGDVIAARALAHDVDDAPWGAHVATADHAAVPQVTFTDPEVASVGHTEASAMKAGLGIRVVDYDLSWISGASTHADHYRGQARAVIDTERQVLVGATFVGPDVAELLHSATIAIVGEVPLHRLWHAVPSYPTVSEVWLRWLEEYRRHDQGAG
ncbi:dihydrolipoyl dehydrogenase family protein [Microbacterium gallinarum]|jgi:pyruvate/2-oxoglutarate dehydrogenase complex dihydrolipoamide dehydrogenase (E3) component|uniref:NAD(P)/FAD-dependent oxidoreductase n=1 Tax=Microbacterium gallinarum TaxID=2762209 RepID=A0ABR8X2V4_9MICO|nr:NAD(P)/FAD-dependent oxidoreductase [Microbacterium gallinarum]MBD8023518.1 NAD(P)/FAD-dependent oxidoreductase [Microbacterium gallinarum]